MKRVFQYIIAIGVLIVALSAARPYWSLYWIGKEVEAAAVYGTKNRIDDTQDLLDKKMKDGGYRLRGKDFHIEKNAKNRVTITVQYKESISIFGIVLKELNLTVEKTASEVKDLF
jgi:major membrane immunogen (membrane-anchored lipoprotein)